MTTRLDSPVTRETSLEARGRPVNVTLVPADPGRAAPVAIELHLKGTQQRKLIPREILRDAVWPRPKKAAAAVQPQDLGFDLDELERALAPFKEPQ